MISIIVYYYMISIIMISIMCLDNYQKHVFKNRYLFNGLNIVESIFD